MFPKDIPDRDSELKSGSTGRSIRATYAAVDGLGGEVRRGFLWLNANRSTELDAAGLVARLKLPQNPEVVCAVDAWLKPLADFILSSSCTCLHRASHELLAILRFVGEAKAERIASDSFKENIADMLSIPPEERRHSAALLISIGHLWSDLSNIPINKYGDYRDTFRTLSITTRNPRRATNKLIQIAKVR